MWYGNIKEMNIWKPQKNSPKRLDEIRQAKIELLDLSTRPFNCLKRNKFDTVGQLMDLIDLGEESMFRLRGMGKLSWDEVKDKVEKFKVG